MTSTYYRRYRPPRRRKSSFKPFFFLVLLLVVLTLGIKACVGVISGLNEEKRDDLILSIDRGSAEVIVAGQSEEAAQSQLVFEGDSIRTAAGSIVTLDLQNGSHIILDENTYISFETVTLEDLDDHFEFVLHDGRVWVDQEIKEEGELNFDFETDVINVHSLVGTYLVSNQADNEYVYVFDGDVDLSFVDRTDDSVVIESLSLGKGMKSVLDDDKERDLLNHENLILSEFMEEGEFLEDDFVLWNQGNIELDLLVENPEEDLTDNGASIEEEVSEEDNAEQSPDDTQEEVPDVNLEETTSQALEESPVDSLSIRVNSPASPYRLDGDAIAIEGSILSGEATSVSVTWSGNGQAYNLGLFEPGSTSFRYVADAIYGNILEGTNSYTIVAYDAEGHASNAVTIVIEANFSESSGN